MLHDEFTLKQAVDMRTQVVHSSGGLEVTVLPSLTVAYQLPTITLHVNAAVDSRPAALTGSALL